MQRKLSIRSQRFWPTRMPKHGSFEEAGPELLTLARIEINELSVSLLSTNCIENVFKNLRRHIGRVSRWREY